MRVTNEQKRLGPVGLRELLPPPLRDSLLKTIDRSFVPKPEAISALSLGLYKVRAVGTFGSGTSVIDQESTAWP